MVYLDSRDIEAYFVSVCYSHSTLEICKGLVIQILSEELLNRILIKMLLKLCSESEHSFLSFAITNFLEEYISKHF